ncbi:Serine/threonine/tyrosine-interacting protein [Ceratocystis lukuohia]|uniref:Serine/threonine/tyrosine-interacting protein n=1 Tax=Ceratocystis lukuohia TaxID=2019550 RepID=A0ABR4MAG9_9PEZI
MDPFLPHNSSSNVQQVAPYSRGAPSPPYINLSGIHRRQKDEEQLEYPVLYFAPHMLPIIGPDSLSEDLVAAAIGIKFTTEKQSSQEWRWNMRHEAQPITDSLLVGPSLVARSKDFLVDAGITMAITVIDPRLIPWQATMRKTVMDAGIEMHVIPAESATEILHSLGDTINMINQHLVSVFCQRVRAAGFSVDDVVRDAAAAYSSGDPKEICAMDAQLATLRGKVLLTCESGNSRSVTVAVAYLMAITGEQMHVVVQFVCTQRFCSIFEEEHKRVLLTWNDILTAKLEVNKAHRRAAVGQTQMALIAGPEMSPRKEKRLIADVYDDIKTEAGPASPTTTIDQSELVLDKDRYEGRGYFAPFIDTNLEDQNRLT